MSLPFHDDSLDVIILLEALYFLPTASTFLSEARRVIRPGGHLLVSCINKDCPDFNPNHPLYFERYGVPELVSVFEEHGFEPSCFGIIPMDKPSPRSRVFKPLKKLAVSLNLIPESMQARQLLKRVVFGRLEPMPRDISGRPAPERRPTPLPASGPDVVHQVVLCAGRAA
jgi:SAM-dependent methyltransferase